MSFVRVWLSGRDGDGATRHWPDDGGIVHQAAWVFDAFAMLGSAEATMKEAERAVRR